MRSAVVVRFDESIVVESGLFRIKGLAKMEERLVSRMGDSREERESFIVSGEKER